MPVGGYKYYEAKFGRPYAATRLSWAHMHGRVKNPHGKNACYAGIQICDEWQSFGAFLRDMSFRPDGYTLDRINPDKGYSKDNCRWASVTTQSRNRRKCSRRKLTEADAAEIRWLYRNRAGSQEAIGAEFGISQAMVGFIIRNENWKEQAA